MPSALWKFRIVGFSSRYTCSEGYHSFMPAVDGLVDDRALRLFISDAQEYSVLYKISLFASELCFYISIIA